MIKKRNIKIFLKTLGYSLEQIHIELIDRSHILSTLWNWSEDWKSSQVKSPFVLNFDASRYAFSFFVFKIQMLHIISHEWSRFIYFRCMFLYEIQNCIFHMFSHQYVYVFKLYVYAFKL